MALIPKSSGGGVNVIKTLTITHMPNKLEYYLDEPMDYTGLTVTATLLDDTVIDVTNKVVKIPAQGEPVPSMNTIPYITYTVGSSSRSAEIPITVKIYSGTFTDEEVTMSGQLYRLLTFTGSGILNFGTDTINFDFYACGGGYNGKTDSSGGSSTIGGNGGNGANFITKYNMSGSKFNIVIGGGNGGVSSIENANTLEKISTSDSDAVIGPTGGTGTGDDRYGPGSPGVKSASSSRPFGDPYFTKLPCGAGGGGEGSDTETIEPGTPWEDPVIEIIRNYGGNGASSEANGASKSQSLGGATGGGRGGKGHYAYLDGGYGTGENGARATYYGSAGGGGGNSGHDQAHSRGGAGYQGVIYIRIPLDNAG